MNKVAQSRRRGENKELQNCGSAGRNEATRKALPGPNKVGVGECELPHQQQQATLKISLKPGGGGEVDKGCAPISSLPTRSQKRDVRTHCFYA